MRSYKMEYIPTGGGNSRLLTVMVPSASSAPINISTSYDRFNSVAALFDSLYSRSGGKLDGMSTALTCFYNVNTVLSPAYNLGQAFGFFVNQIRYSDFAVGDRFKLSNGSYMQIDIVQADGFRLQYYTASGIRAYSDVWCNGVNGTNTQGGATKTWPWLMDLFENMSEYVLQSVPINFYAYSGAQQLYSERQDNYNPTSHANAIAFWTGVEPIDTDDPYQDIEDSEPSGPAIGTGIPETSEIDIPSLPSVSVTDTGFVSLFNPTLAQVKNLADYMWSGLFDLATYKKLFADPMECILGFNMLPVAIPNSGAVAVKVGNISTGVTMNKATSQWVELDCGVIDIGLPIGSYLDYAPYSKFSIYLPYIGVTELSTDDVAGRRLHLVYHIDVLSCSCVAYLKCGPDVLYQFAGACGYSIPVTGNDFRQMIASIISIVATVGGAVATGGLSAPITAAAGAAAIRGGASVAQNVMNSKPNIHRSGAIGSSAGIMGIQKPYLIIEIPKSCKPKKQYHFLGYPSFVTTKLGDISGYAEFENVILDGVPCSAEERSELDALCKGGIYL